MRFLSLIFILIQIITSEKVDNNENKKYSNAIRETLNKLGFNNKKLIDKEDFKFVFINTLEQNLKEFNLDFLEKIEKEDYIKNLLSQIYDKLVEKEKDELIIEDALKLYEPNKILKATEEIMNKIGYNNLIEDITNKVLEDEKTEKKEDNINKDL